MRCESHDFSCSPTEPPEEAQKPEPWLAVFTFLSSIQKSHLSKAKTVLKSNIRKAQEGCSGKCYIYC